MYIKCTQCLHEFRLHSSKKKKQKAPLGFEPRISCLLDRRFNQLSHGARRLRRHPFNLQIPEVLCSDT